MVEVFYKYYQENYKNKEEDISNVIFHYSIDPNIYTIDVTGKLAKLNPNSMFTSMYGSNSVVSSFSSFASIFTFILPPSGVYLIEFVIIFIITCSICE